MAGSIFGALALCLGLAFFSRPARAADAGCFVELDGKVLLDGPCFAEFRAARVTSLSGTDAKGGSVGFSITDEARGRANGLLNVASGQLNSYDEVGQLRREGPCWIRPRFRACAWRAGGARPRL